MPSISQLCAEHRALEAHAAQLLRIVSASVPDTAAVAAMRWTMAQQLFSHCARKDRAIYEALRDSGDDAAVELAERYRDQHRALARSFAAYIDAWPLGRIACEWERFGAESEAALEALAAGIALEKDGLNTLALHVIEARAA
ncbi:hemerythrin domain-containing protein [Sphingomonas sp. M1-B02]|uniref:hemerythrin domain-containing protein n=1 Tax=Sphingomonas sp. M1-B02 TaxID=3114300 RepID=UPI00223F90CA|nr:hemerythrin domain-containing protein [Sphingomonas sp. S6-11]UZK65814.1 hemerythrin domain-containing protein [Sphingomonas sp. S6-11]